MKKVLSFALSMILIVALVLTSMVFASASVIHTVADFESLKTAIENAADGDIITVTGNIENAEPLTIKADVTFNGTGSIEFAGDGFNIVGASVIVESGTFSTPNDEHPYKDEKKKDRVAHPSKQLFELTNTGAEETKADVSSDLTINGGKFLGVIYTNTGYSDDDRHNLVINGGEFTQSKSYLLHLAQGHTLTEVNGGKFYGAEDTSYAMVHIWDGNTIVHLNAGEFNAPSNSIVAFRNSKEVTIGKPDGTGPKMVSSSGAYMMYIASECNTDSPRTIYGGEFIQKKGGYILDFNTRVDGPFVIKGGIFSALESSNSDIIRINDSNLKDFTIEGGTFNQYSAGKNVIVKNNGSLNVTGGTFNMLNEETTSAVIYTGKEKTNGDFNFDGTNVVINNKGKGSVIEHHSACVANISNFKHETKGEDAAPILNIDVTLGGSVSVGNKVNLTGCEFTSESSSISLAGLPVELNIDDTSKLISKSYAINNQNDSVVALNNATIDSLRKVSLQGAVNGKLTFFATLAPNSTYLFSYDRTFTEGNAKTLTPYVEAVMANGTTEVITPIEVLEESNGVMKTTVKFKTPEGIADAKNIRVGVKAAANAVSAKVDNWQIFLTDKFEMKTGTNLLDANKIYKGQALTAYAADVEENVLMVEGSFDASNVKLLPECGTNFDVRKTHILVFRGENGSSTKEVADPTEEDPGNKKKVYEDAQPGGKALIYQEVEVEAGKTYMVSANIRYASAGSDITPNEKKGIELFYKKGASYTDLDLTKLPDDAAEYKEVYLFTAPADIDVNTKNIKLVFNFGSAYVSGYATNFSIIEVDPVTNAVLGEELVVNGDFSTGSRSGWLISGSYYTANVAPYVENYFSKETAYTPSMMYFDESDDYATHMVELMLKPSTTYEVLYQLKLLAYNKDKKPGMVIYRGLYNDDRTDSSMTHLDYKDEENPNVKYEELDNNYIKITITTEDNLRTHGNRNFDFRLQGHTNSAGYYGALEIYELDANGNRVGGNIAVNGDYSFGMTGWKVIDSASKRTTILEQVPGFLDNTEGPETMIYADGSAQNQNYSTTVTVDASKNYWFSGYYVNMNSAGITPRILYQSRKANGAYEVLDAEMKYNSEIYYFEMNFAIPEDAVVKNGKVILKIQMNNGNKGKAYFRELRFAEEGKFANLIESMTGPEVFKEVPYDAGVFVFYYDDSNFDDGDWSGELAGVTATTGAVSGRVVNSKQESIAGMTMMLTPGNNTVKTDENGSYSFTKLAPGNYELYLVEPNGNKILCYSVEVKAGILSNIPLITYLDASELTIEMPEDEDGAVADQTPYGALRGYYLDKDGKPIKGAKIYLKGLGFVTTNAKGMFEFSKLPVGEYEVYTKLADGSVHVFRKVKIEAYKGSLIKLVEPTTGGFNWLWVIIPSAVVLLAGAAFVTILIIKKKKVK